MRVDLEKLESQYKEWDKAMAGSDEEWHMSLFIMQDIPSLITELRETRAAWRPIETAPKDGSYLLLCEGWFVTLGTWMKSDALRDEAWIAFDSIRTIHKTTVMSPTHWMPLPAVPELAKALVVEE